MPKEAMHPLAEQIHTRFPEGFLEAVEWRGDIAVIVKREHLHTICRYLKDDPHMDFDYIVHVSSVDWPDDEERVEVVYEVYSVRNRHRIRIKTRVPEDDCIVDSLMDIWLGADGYLQAIIDAGFDGVYLDWVEAYSDESVLDIAESDGVDARQEMIWWVADIADFVRSQNPDFLVIGQNAAELAEVDDYLDAIDAIAQEQVWFDGGADNDPPGDCPLPRNDNDVDTDAYRDTLSPSCQRQFDDFPDSTLHVSSEEYLRSLHLAQQKGVLIFTVDYALEPENVAWLYRTAREQGFIPFVGSRALDEFVAPFPD